MGYGKKILDGYQSLINKGKNFAKDHPYVTGSGGAMGIGGVGYGGYQAGYQSGREEDQSSDTTRRNLAFGAGLATGTALPKVVKNVHGIYKSMSGGTGGSQNTRNDGSLRSKLNALRK